MIHVGCAGFVRSQAAYFQHFRLVEIQQTFYKPPMLKTALRWREQAPPEFGFALKAWQLITHPRHSPTYARAGLDIPATATGLYGSFRPTPEVLAALNNIDLKEPLIFEDFSVNLLKKSPDDFVVFSKAGDLFHPSLLHEFFAGLESSPSADVIYTDSEYRSSISGETAPFFKPSALSPELMLSVNYLSRAFLRASALADDHMGFPDLMSLEYDLDLRLMKQDTIFHHIPRVLISTSDLYPVREGARL